MKSIRVLTPVKDLPILIATPQTNKKRPVRTSLTSSLSPDHFTNWHKKANRDPLLRM